MALTDIFHDYLSRRILISENIGNIDKVPEWTNCKMEWTIVQIDFIIRMIIIAVVTIILIKLIKNIGKKIIIDKQIKKSVNK
ncbi:MAG: hypothetical protein JXB50_05140 [Spirochaetes bacterium]|nr:hypothetical protein [Spirochaetota bacterium]